jgi:hypothetical protein
MPARPTAPGWNPDPYARHELRYWDGDQWTGHVSDAGTVGLEWAEVPASTGDHPGSEAPIPAGAQLATVGGPTYGTRPGGLPNWATTRSGLHTLPGRPPPSPHFNGPTEPDFWGKKSPKGSRRWYQAPWLWLLILLGGLVVAAAFVLPSFSDGEPGTPAPRVIDAAAAGNDVGEPKATPDGYRVVGTDTYRFAIPGPWSIEQLDAAVLEPGEGTADLGLLTVASDPLTSDTVSVVRYHGLTGNVRAQEQLNAFEVDFRAGVAPTPVVGVQTSGISVLGLPAARLVATTGTSDTTTRTISTAIDTPDGIFQLTVTSSSPERAALLNALIVPTFAAR